MIDKGNIVLVFHDGGRCYINVEKIIGINLKKRRIYFDSTYWDLCEYDFKVVCESWTGVDLRDEYD